MKNPVIALGLDAADPVLIDKWISQGYLQNLKTLREQGAYGRLTHLEYYKAETPWTTFLTGCLPEKTGYWAPLKYYEGTYNAEYVQAYDFEEYQPFYGLGDDYRVAVFDMPQSVLSEKVNGLQVLAWGAHSPQTPSHSRPVSLFKDIIKEYGEHPALHKDHGDWWDKGYINRLKEALQIGIKRRSTICRDWLKQEKWNLFLTIFGETHSAGHDFWYLSQEDHPLYSQKQEIGDPMLETFESVDRAIGEILAEAPEDAYLVVFAAHGSDNNTTDVPSMLLLPEFLYRYSFPGKFLLPQGKSGAVVPPPVTSPQRMNWQEEIWREMYHPNPIKPLLRRWGSNNFNSQLDRVVRKLQGKEDSLLSRFSRPRGPLVWQPVMWYQELWPQMKAFALPSFSEGYIRINLEGREPGGIVAPSEYNAVCQDLTEQLYELKNPRTGESVVKNVVHTRQSASDRDPKLPDADLVVVWKDRPADVIDSPKFGRIGPVPYRRTGSHRSRGFLTVKGPGIEGGSILPEGRAVDLPPTILELMGAPIPEYMDGKPLVKVSIPVS
ncbi:MAG: alkaline phosphatase family protein [Trichodesmium sp. MO_231.B1]|nr:alkaline phosphatase family protein [Trichodesmium sp. MO_231.B1]